MNREKRGLPLTGGSMLLTAVAVLCLVTFSLLALSTARAGRRLSIRSQEAVAAYYRADCRAEEILARLRAGEMPEGVTEENGVFTYLCPISQDRTLQVQVRMDGSNYTVLQWQAVTSGSWQADDSLPVWQGTVS